MHKFINSHQGCRKKNQNSEIPNVNAKIHKSGILLCIIFGTLQGSTNPRKGT